MSSYHTKYVSWLAFRTNSYTAKAISIQRRTEETDWRKEKVGSWKEGKRETTGWSNSEKSSPTARKNAIGIWKWTGTKEK